MATTLKKCLLQYIAESEIGMDEGALLSFFGFNFSDSEYLRIKKELIADGLVEADELGFYLITDKGLKFIDYKLTWDGYKPK